MLIGEASQVRPHAGRPRSNSLTDDHLGKRVSRLPRVSESEQERGEL